MVTNPLKDKLSVPDSWKYLAEGLLGKKQFNTASFFEFVRDIWARGYDRPDLFNVWHVELICNDVEEALAEGKNYVAILPRVHFKSTVLGHAFSLWRLFTIPDLDASILYLSYSDGMAQEHIGEIKKYTRRNPILSDLLRDKTPNSDFSFRYSFNNRNFDIKHGGLFSFKRGLHVSGAMVADDILRDPDNMLNLNQLAKVEEHFLTESMFIPMRDTPTIVLGTPMMPNDLLTRLRSDDRFKSRVLPALDPVPGRRVLMPELYNEEWLLNQKKNHPRSFASEFMLTPVSVVDAYLEEGLLDKAENSQLISLNPLSKHEFESELTVAGFDVGKKRHPSHLVIYRTEGAKIIQICQFFMDGWPYTKQVQLLNEAVDNFKIDKGYVDNTRGELEERGLNSVWKPLTFSAKNKRSMAQKFEEYLHKDRIELIMNERQKSQIASVNGDLQAPETPMGHGDSFWSNALAVWAHFESFGESGDRITIIGDLQSIDVDLDSNLRTENKDDISRFFDKLLSASKKDLISCPSCGEKGPWIEERQLCLLCLYRTPKI